MPHLVKSHAQRPQTPKLLDQLRLTLRNFSANRKLKIEDWMHCKKVFQHGDTEDTEERLEVTDD